MRNITTPLDMIGALVTPRQQGEPAAAYRRRVLKAAGVLTERDPSNETWEEAREDELEGHTGYPATLRDGSWDPQLMDEARSRLFTYDRMEEWEGPFRWPEYGAAGHNMIYGGAAPVGSGVGSLADLTPARDPATGRHYVQPGFVVIEGKLWYIAAKLKRISLPLPTGTTSTVVLPYQIQSDHPHRVIAIDKDTVALLGEDGHQHVLDDRAGELYQAEFQTGSTYTTHKHALKPIDTNGPCFMSTSPRLPTTGLTAKAGADCSTQAPVDRADVIDGFEGVPVLHTKGVKVSTRDGLHTTWVDPYDYYAGTFELAGQTHVHPVTPNGDHLLAEAAGFDGHTHEIDLPELPEARPIVPVPNPQDHEWHPFMVGVRDRYGWTEIYHPDGLGEQITFAYDTGSAKEIPYFEPRPDDVIGLGLAKPATHVHVLKATPKPLVKGGTLELVVRTEDEDTGGVPQTPVDVELDYLGDTRQPHHGAAQGQVSSKRAEAVLRVPIRSQTGARALRVQFVIGEDRTPAGTITLPIRE